ncbi:hypothetical protein EHQ43_17395 [Leptospira bouyouniensis]|uniref:Uncharacterized protein n=1 Tax=Leptospira bouyouniensis TaxID=2484911 RepID=A0A7I0HPB5_9LEPT|nr:hypothetical protein [Leptospira bouyouniensis]TGL03532.1 hypothetical protein EHQ43_17395 [Leptospira bouyouniensis]
MITFPIYADNIPFNEGITISTKTNQKPYIGSIPEKRIKRFLLVTHVQSYKLSKVDTKPHRFKHGSFLPFH